MKKTACLFLLAGVLLLGACAPKNSPAPESANAEPYRREALVVLGNLHRSVGGFARLEYLVSFPNEEGTAWFRSHKNDFAMVLLEALSIERFDGLGTAEGNKVFVARMTALANKELSPMRGQAELARFELR